MAVGEYIVNWTHPSKAAFTIQPNEINGPGEVNSQSPLRLYGRFTVNYGEIICENFCRLLEHFAAPTEPESPTSGMIWFDSSVGDGVLKFRNVANSAWVAVGTGIGGGGGGAAPEVSPAGNFVAQSNKSYFINTSTGAVTVTLPSSPTVGDVIGFTDLVGTMDINTLTIAGNGKLVMGDPSTMVVDVKFATFKLGFSGNTYGWRIVA